MSPHLFIYFQAERDWSDRQDSPVSSLHSKFTESVGDAALIAFDDDLVVKKSGKHKGRN